MAVANVLGAPQGQYGGYDHTFVTTVPDRYICSTVCTKVLRDPHITSCCGQHVCASCLNYWFLKHREESCPHCRAKGENFKHFLDKKLKREILELKVRCINREKGCEWMGEVESLEKHIQSENGCGFVEIMCTNKCDERMLRKDLMKHLKKHCANRLILCEYCELEGKHRHLKRHYRRCNKYPLACPNKCGADEIKRENMPAHREVCPLEPVGCPFAEAGCNVGLVRNQLDNHLIENQQSHLLQLMADNTKIKQQLHRTQTGLAITTGRLASMQEAISRDVTQLQTTSGTVENEATLKSIQTHVGYRDLNEIKREGREHGLTFSVPSIDYFKHNTDWYSPAFYAKGLKACIRAKLAPQGHLDWWLVILGIDQSGWSRCMLIGDVNKEERKNLPFIFDLQSTERELHEYNNLKATTAHRIQPTTNPLILNVSVVRNFAISQLLFSC